MKPEFVEYNGHGMIERYPKSMSQTYIVGHETRHRVRNRLQATSRGETVSQRTAYTVSFSGGSPVITEGLTRSQTESHRDNSTAESLKQAPTLKRSDISIERSELTALKKRKLGLEQKIRKLDTRIKEDSKDPVGAAPSGEIEVKRVEKQRFQNKNTRITKEIASLEGSLEFEKKDPQLGKIPTGGAPQELRAPPKEDFATLREMSELINNSFLFMKTNVPGVTLRNGPGSAIQTKNSIDTLNTNSQTTFFDIKFTFHSDFARLRSRDLKEFETRLSKLDRAAATLSDREEFRLKRASNSNPKAISLKTSFESPEGKFSIGVNEVAKGERIVSNKFGDPFSPLNLSGSFSVRGHPVSLSESDSLNDIANKINYGEDSNKNGSLDLAEDINASGTLENLFIPGVMTPQGFSGSLSYFEDINFDRQIDPSEDLNNNTLLDGGIDQHKVSASIERGRLTLESLTANKITLSGDTGILKEIGFFTEDGNGATIREERQLLPDGTNLNEQRRRAELTVNDRVYRGESNEISDLIPSTRISLNSKTSQNISVHIKKDLSGLIDLIKEFRSSYNSVMQFINDQELSLKILDKSPPVQNARSLLIDNLKASSPKRGLKELSPEKIGISHSNEKRRIDQLSITNLTELIRKKSETSTSIPFSGQNSLLGSIKRTGVVKTENDNLTLDEEVLNRSLNNNLEATISLITGEQGIASRIGGITDRFINEVTGVLQLQQDVASIYAENQTILEGQRRQLGRIQTSNSRKSVLSTVISKGIIVDKNGPANNVKIDKLS